MLGGIILIMAGVLIALYPPLLSIIVAMLFIAFGIMAVTVGYYNRRMHRHYDNPIFDLFFRF